MNLAYYGDLAWHRGCNVHLFDVHASEIQPQSGRHPRRCRPGRVATHNYPEVAERRRNTVLDRMQELGIVTAAQATDAKKPSVKSMLRIQKSEVGPVPAPMSRSSVNTSWNTCSGLKALGANRAERLLNINRGGLRIPHDAPHGLAGGDLPAI